MKSLSVPFRVYFSVTGRCNLRCVHCLAASHRGDRELSPKALLSIADKIGRAGVLAVSVFGGEPLLCHNIQSILERLSCYPLRITLNTNGTLINRSIARALVKNTAVKEFVVSLDGTETVHDRLRGSGTYRAAVRGIEFLSAEGAAIVTACTVNSRNLDDMESVATCARSLGVSLMKFGRLHHCGGAVCNWESVSLLPEQEEKAQRCVLALSHYFPGFIVGNYVEEAVSRCVAAADFCMIRPDGALAPCPVLWETVIGNVRTRSLTKEWKTSPALDRFRKQYRYRPACSFPGSEAFWI